MPEPARTIAATPAPSIKPEAEPRSLASKIFNVAIIVVGGGALVYMLNDLGWSRAAQVFVDVGFWFVIILALDVVALGLESAAVYSFICNDGTCLAFTRVLAAQWSGRAINILTPFGALGEATKVTLLDGHAPRKRIVSSIVLLDLATFYLSVAVVLIGVPVTLLLVHLPPAISVMVWIGLAILVPLVSLLAVAVHRGLVRTLIGILRTTRLISKERMARWRDKLADVDKHLHELHRGRTTGTTRGLVFVLISRLVTWFSTILLLHAAGVGLSVTLVIGVFSVGVLVSWISSIVPLGLGLADGSNYALYDVLGAGGMAGLLVTLVNRARSIALAILGLGAMALANAADVTLRARRGRAVTRTPVPKAAPAR